MFSKDTVYAKIKESGSLPTLPEILVKLLDVCDDESVSLVEIAAIISKDPALSFRVLQLVNSAYYGLPNTFTSIEQAVVYLGSNSIKNIVVTTSIHEVFERKRYKQFENFDIAQFWYHSLLCATIAKRIAQKTDFDSGDEAYLSGLLHDIGRLVLLSAFPKEHETILSKTDDPQNMLWAENQLIGANHCDVGAWMIEQWKLNSMMASAVQYHHEPLEKIQESFPLVKIVYLSHMLSGTSHEPDGVKEASDILLGVSYTDLLEITHGSHDELEEIAGSLNIVVRRSTYQAGSVDEKDLESEDITEEEATAKEKQQEESSEGETAAQLVLADRVKNLGYLSHFLERLSGATDKNAIFTTVETFLRSLFNIDKVVFFMVDADEVLLAGQTSSENNLGKVASGLSLPIGKSTSAVVRVFQQQNPYYLNHDTEPVNLADRQLLNMLGAESIALLPLAADNAAFGVVVLAMPETCARFTGTDLSLIEIICRQVAMSLALTRLKKEKDQEIQLERMAAVSIAARKFAHEINNPLGIINNYLKTLTLKLDSENNIEEEINIIGEELERISSLVGQLDLFSQTAEPEPELIDVNELIENMCQLLTPTLFRGSGKNIILMLDSDLPKVQTSADLLKQVLLNLLKNAAEALAEGGSVKVSTKMNATPPVTGNMQSSAYFEIRVSDNGPGLPESVEKELYKPFVSTKDDGHSGLGLSIVYKSVQDLGGSISCRSTRGEGVRFSIFLPVVC